MGFVTRRGWVLVLVSWLAGCAAGNDTPPGVVDGGGADGAAMDGGSADAGDTPDAGPGDDAGGDPDAGPMVDSRTCEACETHEDCAMGSFCVSLSVGGRACVPGCVPDIPTCPRAFSCVLDVASGVDTTVCLPVGGACCVDEDADAYGQGVGCMGDDCNDLDENINPGVSELCNGVDDDCDGTPDDPPTDCLSGRCSLLMDGTYSAVEGADCMGAMCASGTTTACGLFSCEDGGELGNRCATACDPGGSDDDAYCIDGAHCDGGACLVDEGNGGTCDEDTDCVSDHCDNGFCCDMGVCCGVTTDCPGGGGVARLCDTPMTCQGSRGETECTMSECHTMMGIDDDTACDSSVMARDCGLYDPIFCTGAADQTAPACPTSCTVDPDCIDAGHCEFGFCVPDRPPGSSCSRNQDCQAGLTCVDGVCCTTACTGRCESCNLAGMAGSCGPVPATGDPDGECPGFSCDAYFDGFGAGEDVCYRRQPVSDAAAACNGAGACLTAPTMCPLQPRGGAQIDCDNACQAPISGTCTGTTAGACRDLDDPMDQLTCGLGACVRSTQRCVGGSLRTCTPGTPVAESCNGLDDDCNGVPDNGPSTSLCPPPGGASTVSCIGGSCRIDSCAPGTFDVDGAYANGCECADDPSATACAASTDIGAISAGSSTVVMGAAMPGQQDWYQVDFPSVGRGPANGNPQIRLTGPSASNFELDFFSACGSSIMCGTGMAAGVGSYSFIDDQSSGVNAYSGSHTTAWPNTVVFRVRRTAAATTCAQTAYQVTISR